MQDNNPTTNRRESYPFYFVQLANFRAVKEEPGDSPSACANQPSPVSVAVGSVNFLRLPPPPPQALAPPWAWQERPQPRLAPARNSPAGWIPFLARTGRLPTGLI